MRKQICALKSQKQYTQARNLETDEGIKIVKSNVSNVAVSRLLPIHSVFKPLQLTLRLSLFQGCF